MLLKNRACTITNLQGPSEKFFRCFSTNHLVANAKKFQLISMLTILRSQMRKGLLRVNFKDRPNFDYHVNTFLKEASEKYHALVRVCNYAHKKTMCSTKCFYNISVFLLSSCLDVL